MGVTHKPKAGSLLTGTEYEASDAHVVTEPLKATTLNATYGDDFAGPTLDAKWTRRGAMGAGTGPYYEDFLGSAMRVYAVASRDWGMTQDFTDKDEFEVRLDLSAMSNAAGAGMGPCILSSAGTGLFLAYRESSRLGIFALTAYATASAEPVGSNSGYAGSTILGYGSRHIMSLAKKKCGGVDLYFWRVSTGLTHWDIDYGAGYDPTDFTPARIGWWHGVQSTTSPNPVFNWFDVVNAYNLSANRTVTPTSGTVTMSTNAVSPAGSITSLPGGGSEWYFASTEAVDRYVMATFSVAQSINRVRLRTRSDAWGKGYVELSDGTKVPFNAYAGGLWFAIDIPSTVSTTFIKVVWGKEGMGANPGFTNIEAYLAS